MKKQWFREAGCLLKATQQVGPETHQPHPVPALSSSRAQGRQAPAPGHASAMRPAAGPVRDARRGERGLGSSRNLISTSSLTLRSRGILLFLGCFPLLFHRPGRARAARMTPEKWAPGRPWPSGQACWRRSQPAETH